VSAPTIEQVRSVDTNWMDDPARRCKNTDPDLFVTKGDDDDEPPYLTPELHRICDPCEVRTQCLAYALDQNIEFGVWGGMTPYQRSQLVRPRSRKTCVGCGRGDGIVTEHNKELCLACGNSWSIFREP